MKHCPYCLGAFEGRGLYCCPEHRKATARQRARDRSQLKRIYTRIHKNQVALSTNAARWRDIAMGRNVEEHLAQIFPPGSKKKNRVE